MKRHFLTAILIFVYMLDSNAQWYIQNEGMNIGTIRDSYFVNENIGWLLANGNIIYHTSNGGDEWISIDTLDYYLEAFHFIDSLNGWGVGGGPSNNRVINTQDGGYSWSVKYDSTLGFLFRDIYFTDTNNGWVVGLDTVIITNDGGDSWHYALIDILNPWSIFFINQFTGWVAGDKRILKTTDGGENWEILLNSNSELNAITFIDENKGWVVGDDNVILHSNDGGTTWVSQMEFYPRTFYSVSFVDSLNGWTAGSYGAIWHTNNGGQNWEQQESNTQYYLYTIKFVNQYIGWATGETGIILKTISGGTVGINQDKFSNNSTITIYPNPANSQLFINNIEKKSELEIFTLSGKMILKSTLLNNSTIDISGFDKGIYIVNLYNNNWNFTKKFIKQ